MVLNVRALPGLTLALLVETASLTLGEQPGAGVVTGRVELREQESVRERPTVRERRERPDSDAENRRQSIVYLETAPTGAFEARAPGRAVMDQTNETFVPHVLAIQAGTVVDFPNSDDIYHNVFSLSKSRRFDLGRYARGRTKSVHFDKPGVVRVFCEIHSHMSAYIVVFSHRFFSATDASGTYRLEKVPEGRYRVIVWTSGEIRASAWAEVKPGEVTSVDFVVD